MLAKNTKLKYVVKHKEPGIEYAIEEKHFSGEIMYYTWLLVSKNGINYQGMMDRKSRGFKTVEVSKAQLRTLLSQKLSNTCLEKDVANLPIFCK